MWNHVRASVAFSLIAHSTLLALLLYLKPPQPPQISLPLEIELLPPQPAQTRPLSQSQPPPQSQTTTKLTPKTPHLSLSQLTPTPLNFDLRSTAPSSPQNQIIGDGWHNTDFGVQGGTFREIEHFSSYNRVLEEIRGMLEFPEVLALNGVSGTINARLHFKNTHCDWSRSTVFAGERHLRFYIDHILRKLCSFEIVNRLAFKDSQFLDLSFIFRLTHEPSSVVKQEAGDRIVGNVLRFKRSFRTPDLSNIDLDWLQRKARKAAFDDW